MKQNRICALTVVLGLIVCGVAVAESTETPVDFARDIQPIFANHCLQCHGLTQQESGLRLDSKAYALEGGDSGVAAIVPGNSAESRLIELVTAEDEYERMPAQSNPLSPEQIGLLQRWIDQGAEWPDIEPPLIEPELPKSDYWSFQPMQHPEPPSVKNSDWARNPIDNFVLNRLEDAELSPSSEAARVTLIRRLSLTLLGLPPSVEEVDQFVADKSPDAYEKLVERMLASPRYGERWGQHWLDIVRFAETNGFEVNTPRPAAWPYRDYVIQAFNEDKPYTQFIREQLAGNALGVDVATGFLVAGPKDLVGSPDIRLTLAQRMDELHDMINVTGMTFLGLTTGCARCHDHKFDPISQRDYYAMQAVFAGVQHGERELKTPEYEANRKQAVEAEQQLATVKTKLARFEPLRYAGRTIIIDDRGYMDDSDETEQPADQPSVTLLQEIGGRNGNSSGKGPNEKDDPGGLGRLPNIGKGYTWWKAANTDVFTWDAHTAGRFHLWLSWGCGLSGRSQTTKVPHATDARYFLDLDGKLETQDDRQHIATLNHQHLADGREAPKKLVGASGSASLWSGLYYAGIYELNENSRIVLRGGETDAPITADVIVLQEINATDSDAPSIPQLRPAVHSRQNVERFKPTVAKFVRFTVLETSSGEPCIDELEIYTTGETPRNVALASGGAKATASGTLEGFDIHKLEHINDGLHGNPHSWISNEPGAGWVQIELPEIVTVDRIVWGRDLEGKVTDRLSTKYRIEVSTDAELWSSVTDSDDRIPYVKLSTGRSAFYPTEGLATDEVEVLGELIGQLKELDAKLDKLNEELPKAYAGTFSEPEPTYRLYRGDPFQKRELVTPGAINAIGEVALRLEAGTPEQERRKALAEWIADPQNPLTARVMVNRIWYYHFGEGIVSTPSDFGVNGTMPSHPELLDWLASAFIDSGWSVKAIQRLIVLSNTYRQSSHPNERGLAVDADARLLWRYPPRRLEAEAIRDSILSVSGTLDLAMGGVGYEVFEPNTNYVRVYHPKKEYGPTEWRRMVYQRKIRIERDATFGAFDCPDAGQTCPKRTRSTTALQALNLLNSHFMVQQAEFFAERLSKTDGSNTADQVRHGFKLTFGREPDAQELHKSVELIESHGLVAFCRTMLNTNEFLFVN